MKFCLETFISNHVVHPNTYIFYDYLMNIHISNKTLQIYIILRDNDTQFKNIIPPTDRRHL